MWSKNFVLVFLLSLGCAQLTAGQKRQIGNLQLSQKLGKSAIDIVFESSGHGALFGHLGQSLSDAIGQPTGTCNPGDSDECLEWGDFARLYLTSAKAENSHCARVEWYSPYARRVEDCFEIQSGVHWYGGPGPKYPDTWPIEQISRAELPIATGMHYGAVAENYWLVSSGVSIHVDEDVALFFSVNSTRPDKFCLIAEDKYPFRNRGDVRLKYDICTGTGTETFKDVHQRAIKKYYATPPRANVDQGMLLKPLWSTWAEYKRDINQTLVIELATRVVAEGFGDSSHIEIDDDWETCYGQLEFNPMKFPDPAAMTATLRELGLRTTLWAHPFINYDCPLFDYAVQHDYLVKDEKGKPAMTGWWVAGGDKTGMVDFTNEAAVEWWSKRLEVLRLAYGIDSFKFDAGEANDLPYSHHLTGNSDYDPNLITTKYVEAVAKFGNMIEVRVARQNQNEPIFIRMNDKTSQWSHDNGLQSLIPTLLDFGLKGYPFVLPDMVGGNAYDEGKPSKELVIRWMQANAFMPSVQLSLVPWNYDQETVDIFKAVLALRAEYEDKITLAGQQAVTDGSPINRPMWWMDPTDVNTYTIDDQYMLGDDLLVAPVVVQGATSRSVYLPKGQWVLLTGPTDPVYEGPGTVQDLAAPLDTLLVFLRQNA